MGAVGAFLESWACKVILGALRKNSAWFIEVEDAA